jgi:hypothetical protein
MQHFDAEGVMRMVIAAHRGVASKRSRGSQRVTSPASLRSCFCVGWSGWSTTRLHARLRNIGRHCAASVAGRSGKRRFESRISAGSWSHRTHNRAISGVPAMRMGSMNRSGIGLRAYLGRLQLWPHSPHKWRAHFGAGHRLASASSSALPLSFRTRDVFKERERHEQTTNQ